MPRKPQTIDSLKIPQPVSTGHFQTSVRWNGCGGHSEATGDVETPDDKASWAIIDPITLFQVYA